MRYLFLFMLTFVVISGCQTKETSFPFNKIDDDFGLSAFEIPESWNVLQIGYHFSSENPDEPDLSKRIYTEEPHMVQFHFGRASEENEIDMEEMRLLEEGMAERGSPSARATKLVYKVSADQQFAELWINKEDPDLLETKLENMHRRDKNRSVFEYGEVIEVNGKNVYYSGMEGDPPEKFYWASSDAKLMFSLLFFESELGEEERQLENMLPILEKLIK
ncbi:hypothetical protein BKP35_09895 [Anaerobacillus arseniciselenatis]|uniref:Uncharacterized protein n=1 Tax=Anaerobacillus arseniciselenatis TaxID=85682 RepID=A0A1S2LKB9_9BACI|nr:hypothetical protein [Anaerobacillus arseniciselenatis]OIJ12871.1 hypothetical protein BKP35_09895 [Anaerobacillus arseniciselenatis]